MEMKKQIAKIALAALMAGFTMIVFTGSGHTQAVAASPLASSAAEQPAASVNIDNFTFGPNQLNITAGTTVRWTNKDDIPHNIVADDKSFKSKVLDTDDSFTYTFTTPGTYKYFCGLHPKMTGTVVVK
jgi:plastocyanin